MQEKPMTSLKVGQFCERFCIPKGVSVQPVDGEAVSTEKFEDNAIYFSKEQFNAGLRFTLPSLFKEFLHFTQIPPAYIHPNIVRVLMGCSILNMLFNLDLSLLEVLFIYSIKKGKTDLFSLFAHIPSLQLVTNLPDSMKGKPRTCTSQGCLGWTVEHPERSFSPKSFIGAPGWLTFGCGATQTLLTARNLLAVAREPQPYVTNILLRRLPKRVVPGEHFVLKDLPFYKRAREADTKACQERLDQREKKRQERTLRKALGEKRRHSSPTARPPATKEKKKTKKTKKTLAQVLRIVAPTPEASSSSCRSGPSRPDHIIPKSEEAENLRPPPVPHSLKPSVRT
ncbi:hypothetical protein CK203_057393 [Vitis vinifera]|uniref:Uncharacterized protein n=1 Tax=Vitis vinifera TaxID=29760 RepID=A0A438FUJ7_VITVI|nr:hypothetical protein CK203_057393 [Vitis vinifera]